MGPIAEFGDRGGADSSSHQVYIRQGARLQQATQEEAPTAYMQGKVLPLREDNGVIGIRG